MNDIRKCTQSLNKNSVEQTAYFRAWGKKNNLDMDKFRQEVQNELDGEAKKKEKKGWQWDIDKYQFLPIILYYNVLYEM